MTDVWLKESVEFGWQAISARGFVIVEVLERISAFFYFSQDFFSSSLSAVTFFGLKNGEFLKFLGLI